MFLCEYLALGLVRQPLDKPPQTLRLLIVLVMNLHDVMGQFGRLLQAVGGQLGITYYKRSTFKPASFHRQEGLSPKPPASAVHPDAWVPGP
jgi:hypothetical protein